MSAISRIQEERFGGRLQPIRGVLTITTTPQPLIKADMERVSLTMVNTGTVQVWAHPNEPAAAGTGFRLAASGGGLSLDAIDDPDLVAETYYLVVASGTFWVLENRPLVRSSWHNS